MILINKLIVVTKESNKTLNLIENLIRNKDGDIDFSIVVKIPVEIKNFKNPYGVRFDKMINEINMLNEKMQEEEVNEIIKECKIFMEKSEIDWVLKAVELKNKYGAYSSLDYYRLNTSLEHNFLYWDDKLPLNNKKQYSFYTEKSEARNWVKNLSKIFEDVVFELRYKEKSMSKYKKITIKNGDTI